MDKFRKKLLREARELQMYSYKAITSKERLLSLRHPSLVALGKIGPIFPGYDEGTPRGMRGAEQKKTKSYIGFKYREKRRRNKRYNR